MLSPAWAIGSRDGAGQGTFGRAPGAGVRQRSRTARYGERPQRQQAARAKRKRARKPRGRTRKRLRLGRVIYWSLVLALWLVIGGVGTIAWVGAHLPPIQSLEIPKRPPSIQIVDLDGRPLATRGDMGGAVLPLKELPPYVPKAFIAIEDRRFYEHYGVDPFGIARALIANVLHRGVSAGRLHHHAAARQKPVPDPGAHHPAQAAGGAAGALAGAQILQEPDSRALSQPRLFRRRRLRHRAGRAALFRQTRQADDARRKRRCLPDW